jgi:hypothetical protein
MIEDLIEVIDRSWQSLQKRTGTTFALACFPFLDQLKRDPRTASILDELRRENLRSREKIRATRERSRTQALAIFQELQTLRPDIFPTEPAPQGYDCTAETILLNLRESSQESEADVWASFEEPGTCIGLEATLLILRSLLAETGVSSQFEARRRMRDRATGTLHGALFGRRFLRVDSDEAAAMPRRLLSYARTWNASMRRFVVSWALSGPCWP